MKNPANVDCDRRVVLKAAAASLLALGLSPQAALAQGKVTNGGRLRVIHYQNPSSLDPHTGITGSDYQFLFALYDRLLDFDPDTLDAKPGLATAWKLTDPKTLLLTLRPGVMFHDGTALDAEAVRFNLERAMTHPRSNIKPDVASISTIEVTGPLEVTIRLKAPDASLLLALTDRAGMIASPTAIKAAGDNYDRKPVGAGQYKFVDWLDNDKITLDRDGRYWMKGSPHLDGIDFRIVPDLTTGVRSLIAGEADFVVRVPTQQLRSIEQRPDLKVSNAPTIQLSVIYINYAKAPFNDLRVRQAINYAVDRKTYSQVASAGAGELAWSLLPKSHWAYNKSLDEAYPYDPERARRLLSEANATNLKIELLSWSDQLSQQKNEVLVEQLRKVGIGVKLIPGSLTESATKFFAGTGNGFISRWTNRPDPALGFFYMFGEKGPFNATKSISPELAPLLPPLTSNYDRAARVTAFDNVSAHVSRQALCVPLIFERDISAYDSRVQGYRPNLQAKHRFDDVWLQQKA
jgi:peptide/nickel transport system substrate-binding protein